MEARLAILRSSSFPGCEIVAVTRAWRWKMYREAFGKKFADLLAERD
jgi:hypothetical protein